MRKKTGRREVELFYIKESIQADEIKIEKEAECEEALWCNIVTRKLNINCWVSVSKSKQKHRRE